MSGLFLKYPSHNLVQINTINKVNLSTVIRLVTSIVPPKSTPLAYKAIENGFLITFRNDKDINSFFVPDNLSKLEHHNLSPTLTPISKNNREVYIPGVSKYIYYLPKHKIITEIKQKTNIDSLFISFFTSSGGSRYLVITVDSKAARDKLISQTVTLFDCECKPQPKLQLRSTQPQQSPLTEPHSGRTNRASVPPTHFTHARPAVVVHHTTTT